MLIYAAIGAAGLIILIFMLIVGDLFGGDGDAGHDIAHVDHGGGPSVLSVRVMASFLTAFGVGGVVARYYHLSHPVASGIGVAAGVVMASIVYQFARLLYSQQASTNLTMNRLVGVPAVVSIAIPANGVGQVSVNAAGEVSEHLARSAGSGAIARGTSVVITGLGGDAVMVTPSDPAVSGGLR
jgi:membrane protein implicated in regulation of membrane protease activity